MAQVLEWHPPLFLVGRVPQPKIDETEKSGCQLMLTSLLEDLAHGFSFPCFF